MTNDLNINADRKIAAVIMAAGQGKRMKDPTRAKVMYELNGKPMVHYVADLAYDLGACRVIVVVGYQREVVINYLRTTHPEAQYVNQEQQLGTGHAVLQTEESLSDFEGDVLVLSGDVPLLTRQTTLNLLAHHCTTHAAATILTAMMEDPTGYGRIIRNADGSVKRIVEHQDATEEERRIREINSGIYLFEKKTLFDGLRHITPHNVQNEYYLTDVFEYFWGHRWTVSALLAKQAEEIHGINTVEQLEKAHALLEPRLDARRTEQS
jgi:UDP-N-acetylglucosamine diphosphorylase/glucosamine-1-phosphate N-acetyltransferase